jgi:hypothetical protein
MMRSQDLFPPSAKSLALSVTVDHSKRCRAVHAANRELTSRSMFEVCSSAVQRSSDDKARLSAKVP